MSRFSPSSSVTFQPLTRQIDGAEVVIGRPETQTFLSLPVDALEVIDALAAGETIAATQASYAERHGETPDIVSLLDVFDDKGFLVRPESASQTTDEEPAIRFHFESIPQGLARGLFSLPALALYGLLIVGAVAAVVAEPSLRPSWTWLFFEQDFTLLALLLMTAGLGVTFVHEMAHLTAAQAQGVQCRLGIGHRLWMLVAETDMTGVWSLPRRKRFLPILAGPLADAVSGALVFLVLFADLRGLIHLPPLAYRVLQAMTMVYLLGLTWQLYFFVRTDLYYLYTTAFHCKDLMNDTKNLLMNQLNQLLGRRPKVDQSHLPSAEMRAIKIYSIFWIVGRTVAFGVLFAITLPLLWHYFSEMGSRLLDTSDLQPGQWLDAVVFATVNAVFLVAGFGMWFRSIYLARRLSRETA